MAYERPSITEIKARLITQAQSQIAAHPERRDLIMTLIKTLSGASHEWYGALDYIKTQLYWTSATGAYLDRWAGIFGLQRRLSTKAVGTATVIFSASPVSVPRGTVFISEDDVSVVTTSDVDSSSHLVTVEAVNPGTSGNLADGLEMSPVSPIAGVMGITVVTMGQGTDDETDDSLRARLLYKTQNPPRGGTMADYVSWTMEVTGVTRAWCYPHEPETGEVTVRFMTDGLTADGIPDADAIAAVTNHLTEVAPIGAVLQVLPPVKQLLDITVTGLLPENLTVQEQVKAKIAEVIFEEAEPGGILYRSHISSAISNIPEVVSHEITVPDTEIIVPTGKHLFMLGEVTFN